MTGDAAGPLDVLPVRVILNRIFVYHVTGMDQEQRDKYEADLYGWGDVEAEALAAVFEAAQADDDGGGVE